MLALAREQSGAAFDGTDMVSGRNGLTPVFSAEQIETRVRELGAQISGDYGADVLHACAIMDDSFVFFADLVRALSCPVICHFIKMETRDTVSGAHAVRNIVYTPVEDIASKHVLVVNTLMDSGLTVDHLVQQLLLKKPKSIRTAALVDRQERRCLPFRVDYAGFPWEGGHLVGYGLDMGGRYRNLPYVATMTPPGIMKSAAFSPTGAAQGGAVT